jgi:hypothetical protein
MKKQEVISQVQNSLGSLFTKDDVINCLNMVVEEKPKVEETKAGYPSKEWLNKIKDGILKTIRNVDFNDSDMFDINEFEFEIRYGNTIEVDSYEVDACSLKGYVENQIEEYFDEIQDEIISIIEHNDKTEEMYQEALKEESEN